LNTVISFGRYEFKNNSGIGYKFLFPVKGYFNNKQEKKADQCGSCCFKKQVTDISKLKSLYGKQNPMVKQR
jgi:hypothetical protein